METHTSIDMGRLGGAEDVKTAPLADVVAAFKTSLTAGLSSASAARRLTALGPNEIVRPSRSRVLRFLSFVCNPLSYVMEAAAIVAIAVANGGGQPPDWQDFVGIVFLLLLNATVGYLEESKAGDAVEAMMASLSLTAKVKRDEAWSTMEAKALVPGDLVAIKLGDVVPADVKIARCENVKVDQSGMTGESLPVAKNVGDLLFSGSTVKIGEAEGVVVATGVNTFFGKTAALVSGTETTSHFQKVLTIIGSFCVGLIVVFEVAIILVMFPGFKYAYRTGINNVLVLLIGGIPIAAPTVLSVTMSTGASALSKASAIVTRITAVEELAGMDVLCSDKTGTLTKNQLEIDTISSVPFGKRTVDDVLLLAARSAALEHQDAIDTAVVKKLPERCGGPRQGIEELHFMPFDPISKRTQITYKDTATGATRRASKGAPQYILQLCVGCPSAPQGLAELVHQRINDLARNGYRAVGVAECSVPDGTTNGVLAAGDADWQFAGIIAMSDPPRDDSAETIRRALALGCQVKMISGDQLAIGKETARRLGMGSNMYEAEDLLRPEKAAYLTATTGKTVPQLLEEMDGVCGVLPEDKYTVVKMLQDAGHVTAMTGDGVNDAPALKRADVGIAVSDSTDAARGAADLVLTEPGLSVIITAIEESRRIFQRMLSYSVFATATTVRIVTMFSVLIFVWKFNFPPFLVLIVALLNDGSIMSISADRVKPSARPDKWNFPLLFSMATVLGLYLALSSVLFFHLVFETTYLDEHLPLRRPPWVASRDPNDPQLHSLMYLQVSISGQLMIFSTRSRWFWFSSRPGVLPVVAFCLAQSISTLIAVYADWSFTEIQGVGWGWALVAWVYSLLWFIPMDLPKIFVRLMWSGEAWRFRLRTVVGGVHNHRVRAGSVQGSIHRASISVDQPAVQHRISMAETINKVAKLE